MSRRDRDSDAKRYRSGFDRESSPKRSRRDGKPETERASDSTLAEKNRRRLRDALPLEAPSGLDSSKVESGGGSKEMDKKPTGHGGGSKEMDKKPTGHGGGSKEMDKKPNGNGGGSKHSANPAEAPHNRSYFQHEERGNAGQVGRSFSQRARVERRFTDSKDERDERVANNKSSAYDSRRRDEKPRGKGDNSMWGHDGFLKMEAMPPPPPPPPMRKRPAFREKKIPIETETSDKATVEPATSTRTDCSMSASERREERDRSFRHMDRSDRPAAGNREMQRGGLPSRDRYGGGGNYRGRERFSERQRYGPSGTRGEKWKHDLFDEANQSPNPKNEEDQIAKIEALLAS